MSFFGGARLVGRNEGDWLDSGTAGLAIQGFAGREFEANGRSFWKECMNAGRSARPE